uniref:Transmembrane protein 14C n=1 Tax=Equus caballus TaxID=9796 RepID=F6SFN4_HORSE
APPLERRACAATFPAGQRLGDPRLARPGRLAEAFGKAVRVQAWCSLLSAQSEREQCRRTPARCSVPSLAAGLLFGGLAGLGAYQLSQDPRNIWVFLATSGTLAGIMGMRFYHSGKFMPAGLIAGASLLMVAKLGISVFSRPHQS